MTDHIKVSQAVIKTEYDPAGKIRASQAVIKTEYDPAGKIRASQLLLQVEYIKGVVISQFLTQVEYETDIGRVYMPNGYLNVSLYTKDGTGGDLMQIFKRKNARYLWYDADTGGNNLIISFYVDGVLQSDTVTINTSTRTRNRVDLPNWEGYRFAFKLNANGLTKDSVKIYSPWHIVYDSFGE